MQYNQFCRSLELFGVRDNSFCVQASIAASPALKSKLIEEISSPDELPSPLHISRSFFKSTSINNVFNTELEADAPLSVGKF